MEYQKINTLFKRDANNIIIPSQFTLPEFEYLKDCKFECTEKVDGTNMRVEIYPDEAGKHPEMAFKGRTDRANIPSHLLKKMNKLFPYDKVIKYFERQGPIYLPITIYGEGYGCKIQQGGNYIRNDVNFRLFDVRIGNWWITRDGLEEIAMELGIDIVPIIGYMTIPEAIDYVRKGFKSTIAENKDYDAEGLVLKTPVGLLGRSGERIITKIKTCDFVKFKAKYGDNPNPEQPINPHYN